MKFLEDTITRLERYGIVTDFTIRRITEVRRLHVLGSKQTLLPDRLDFTFDFSILLSNAITNVEDIYLECLGENFRVISANIDTSSTNEDTIHHLLSVTGSYTRKAILNTIYRRNQDGYFQEITSDHLKDGDEVLLHQLDEGFTGVFRCQRTPENSIINFKSLIRS